MWSSEHASYSKMVNSECGKIRSPHSIAFLKQKSTKEIRLICTQTQTQESLGSYQLLIWFCALNSLRSCSFCVFLSRLLLPEPNRIWLVYSNILPAHQYQRKSPFICFKLKCSPSQSEFIQLKSNRQIGIAIASIQCTAHARTHPKRTHVR